MQKRINLKKYAFILILSLIASILLLYIATLIVFLLSYQSDSLVDDKKQTNCGVLHDYNEKRVKRIVNGHKSTDSFPWIVSLRLILNKTNLVLSGHICGGSLVRTVMFLT